MRKNEFKLRQKEALSRWKPDDSMLSEAVRLEKGGVSRKMICKMFSITYDQLKEAKNRLGKNEQRRC